MKNLSEEQSEGSENRMIIRQAQMDSLAIAVVTSFEDRCVAFVCEQFPEYLALFGEEGVRRTVRAQMQRGNLIGLETERDIIKYVYLSQVLGDDFDVDPECRWVGTILAEPDRSMTERLDLVFDGVTARLDSHLPLRDPVGDGH
jgi:hypothetical protein